MKSVLRWCVVPLLATTLVAQTAPRPKSRKAAPPAQPAVTAEDVQSLRDALAAQQQQIEQLKQQLQQRDQSWQQTQQQLQQAQSAAAEAQQKAASVQTATTEEKDSVAKLSSDMADVKTTLTNTAVGTQDEQKRVSALEGLLGRFRFNGDVRIRGESVFQSAPGFFDRNRGRFRARFGVDGEVSDDFIGGFHLAGRWVGGPPATNSS